MGVDHDHQLRVRRLLWVLLVFASATSLAGNVTHALTQHRGVESIGPIATATLAPVALLGLTHLLGLWSSIRSRDLIFWCILTGIAALAAAAFRLSFDALRTLAVLYGYGHSDAALFPLILDGLVAVCTLGLVGLTRLTSHAVVHADAAATQARATQTQPAAVPVTQPQVTQTNPVTQPQVTQTNPVTQSVTQVR